MLISPGQGSKHIIFNKTPFIAPAAYVVQKVVTLLEIDSLVAKVKIEAMTRGSI